MKLNIYSLILALGGFSPVIAATPPPPPPNDSSSHWFEGETVIYELTGDVVYDLETSLIFYNRDGVEEHDVSVTFRGKSGTENLIFNHTGNSRSHLTLRTYFSDVSLTFENLGSVRLEDMTTTGSSVYGLFCLGAHFCETAITFTIQNIAQDVAIVQCNVDAVSKSVISMSRGMSGPTLVSPARNESLILKNIKGNLEISGNSGSKGVIWLQGVEETKIYFQDIGSSVAIRGNNSGNNAVLNSGGVFFIDNDTNYVAGRRDDVSALFQNIEGGVFFEDNYANGTGTILNIYYKNNSGDVSLHFDNVRGGVSMTRNEATYHGGVISVFNTSTILTAGDIYFGMTRIEGGIDISGNKAAKHAGAIILYGSTSGSYVDAEFKEISGGISVTGNEANAAGAFYIFGVDRASLTFSGIAGDMILSRNISSGSHGGFASIQALEASFSLSGLSGNLTVSGNKSGNFGGAFFVYSSTAGSQVSFSLERIMGDVLIADNAAGGSGGGLLLGGEKMQLLLSADGGDITFQGNTDNNGAKANAITLRGTSDKPMDASVVFSAQKGNSIYFHDPLYFSDPLMAGHEIALNRERDGVEYEGRIVFSGEYWKDTGNTQDVTSIIMGHTTLYNGELVIEQKAVFDGDYSDVHSVTLRKGVMEITTGGRLNTGVFNVTRDAVLRTGDGAYLSAKTIDMGSGFRWDVSPFLQEGTSGLTISNAEVFSLGGIVSVVDDWYFYRDTRWLNDQKYLVLSLDPGSFAALSMSGFLESDLALISEITGDSIVSAGHAYDGLWSMSWEGGDLYAVWTHDAEQGPDIDPYPEPAPEPELPEPGPGEPEPGPGPDPETPQPGHGSYEGNPLNSLWSTLSNMNTLKNTVRGQAGARYTRKKNDNRYWAMGLADFSRHQTVSLRDGYEYSGYGYAIGADTVLYDNVVAGVSFGNAYGTNKSRLYDSEIKQKSYMGMLYGQWTRLVSEADSIHLDWSAAYGYTDNTQKSHYSDRGQSRGTWNNNIFQLALEGAWDRVLTENWILTPFAGVEYAGAYEKAFTDAGDCDIQYGKARMRNLGIPMGIGVTHVREYSNGMAWINKVTASYIPDVYRKNPSASARDTEGGAQWKVCGSVPARNGGRIEWNTRWVINEEWSVFGGYSFEGRSRAYYHGGNLGVSLAF